MMMASLFCTQKSVVVKDNFSTELQKVLFNWKQLHYATDNTPSAVAITSWQQFSDWSAEFLLQTILQIELSHGPSYWAITPLFLRQTIHHLLIFVIYNGSRAPVLAFVHHCGNASAQLFLRHLGRTKQIGVLFLQWSKVEAARMVTISNTLIGFIVRLKWWKTKSALNFDYDRLFITFRRFKQLQNSYKCLCHL